MSRRRGLVLIAVLGVIAYMTAALATDAEQMLLALERLGIGGVVMILMLSLVNYVLRFYRWSGYLAELGHRLPPGRHLLYYFCGFAFTVSPAKAGEAVRSLYLRRHGVPYTESVGTLFVERVLDLLAIALLASLVASHLDTQWPVLLVSAVVIVSIIVVITRPGLPRWLMKKPVMPGEGRIARARHTVGTLLLASQRLMKPRLLLGGVALGIVAWGAEGLGFYLICNGLGIDVAPVSAIGIYSIAALAGGAAFFLPGGIGGMEVVMTTLLVATGTTLATAVIATLLCRLATLWFAVVLGLMAMIFLEAHTPNEPALPQP